MFEARNEQESKYLEMFSGKFCIWSDFYKLDRSMKVISCHSDMENTNVNFYLCSGMVSIFLSELTEFNDKDHLLTVNEMGFDLLNEIALKCIVELEKEGDHSWEFLTNGKFHRNKTIII